MTRKNVIVLALGLVVGFLAGQFVNTDRLEKPAYEEAVRQANIGRPIDFAHLNGRVFGGHYKIVSIVDAESGTAVFEHYKERELYLLNHEYPGNPGREKDFLILVHGVPSSILQRGEVYMAHSAEEG